MGGLAVCFEKKEKRKKKRLLLVVLPPSLCFIDHSPF